MSIAEVRTSEGYVPGYVPHAISLAILKLFQASLQATRQVESLGVILGYRGLSHSVRF